MGAGGRFLKWKPRQNVILCIYWKWRDCLPEIKFIELREKGFRWDHLRRHLTPLSYQGKPSLRRLRGRAATKAALTSLEMRLMGSSTRPTFTVPNHGQSVPTPIGLRQPGILVTKARCSYGDLHNS